MQDFIDAARAGGWESANPLDPDLKPGMVYTITRGPEVIEVEIGNGGIPHKVTRTNADGVKSVLTQNYFTMSEVLGWLPKKGK